MQLNQLIEQLPLNKKEDSNQVDSLARAAEVFGGNFIFGADFEGELVIEGRTVSFSFRQRAVSTGRLNVLLDYLGRMQKREKAESEKMARKSKGRGRR